MGGQNTRLTPFLHKGGSMNRWPHPGDAPGEEEREILLEGDGGIIGIPLDYPLSWDPF